MYIDTHVSVSVHHFIELKSWSFSFSRQSFKQKCGCQEQFLCLRNG